MNQFGQVGERSNVEQAQVEQTEYNAITGHTAGNTTFKVNTYSVENGDVAEGAKFRVQRMLLMVNGLNVFRIVQLLGHVPLEVGWMKSTVPP